MVKRLKIEAIAAKDQKAKRGIRLSNEEIKDYESAIGDKIDVDKANNEYLLQLCRQWGKSYR